MIGIIIAAAFQFRFMARAIHVIDRRDPSNECVASYSQSKAVLALYIAAKYVLAILHY